MKYLKLIDNNKMRLEGSFWIWSPLNHLALRRSVEVWYGELCDYKLHLVINIALLVVNFNINFIIFKGERK